MANPETLERLAQACRHAGYAATVTDDASVRTAGTSGEVLAVLRDEEQGRVAVRLRQELVPLDPRPGAAREQLRLALLLNARLEGARCALDDDNTFVLLDDVLAPISDLVPESVCRLWLLRGQAPWATRLLQQVAVVTTSMRAPRSRKWSGFWSWSPGLDAGGGTGTGHGDSAGLLAW